jgi:YggT family protein
MGAADARLVLDAVSTAQNFVFVFYLVYTLLIFAYIISTWLRLPYSLQPIARFLHDVCEPYLRIFRRALPSLGPLDLSPIVAIALLYVLELIVHDVILGRLH